MVKNILLYFLDYCYYYYFLVLLLLISLGLEEIFVIILQCLKYTSFISEEF